MNTEQNPALTTDTNAVEPERCDDVWIARDEFSLCIYDEMPKWLGREFAPDGRREIYIAESFYPDLKIGECRRLVMGPAT